MPTAYPPKEIDAWAEPAAPTGPRAASRTISTASTPSRQDKASRATCIAYVIHEGKVRAPAAAMALIERLK